MHKIQISKTPQLFDLHISLSVCRLRGYLDYLITSSYSVIHPFTSFTAQQESKLHRYALFNASNWYDISTAHRRILHAIDESSSSIWKRKIKSLWNEISFWFWFDYPLIRFSAAFGKNLQFSFVPLLGC